MSNSYPIELYMINVLCVLLLKKVCNFLTQIKRLICGRLSKNVLFDWYIVHDNIMYYEYATQVNGKGSSE